MKWGENSCQDMYVFVCEKLDDNQALQGLTSIALNLFKIITTLRLPSNMMSHFFITREFLSK